MIKVRQNYGRFDRFSELDNCALRPTIKYRTTVEICSLIPRCITVGRYVFLFRFISFRAKREVSYKLCTDCEEILENFYQIVVRYKLVERANRTVVNNSLKNCYRMNTGKRQVFENYE